MTMKEKRYIECIETLIRKHLRRDKTVTMHVSSRSMRPLLCLGDLIRVRACDTEEARVGDIVVFAYLKRIYTHRVVAIIPRSDGRICLRCKGDQARAFDRLVCEKHLLGRVELLEHGERIRDFRKFYWVWLNKFLAYISNSSGLFFTVIRNLKRRYKKFVTHSLHYAKPRH